MAFHLDYTDTNGQVRKRQFSSYYECVVVKNKLQKKGIEVTYSESGTDITHNFSNQRIDNTSKEAIRAFLKRCDEMGDFKGKKRYATIKSKKD